MSTTIPSVSATSVCEPCKRRKKSCNKAFPSCGRCARLAVKCTYGDASKTQNIRPRERRLSWGGELPSADTNVLRLLQSISEERMSAAIEEYFITYHRALPIINQNAFYIQLRANSLAPEAMFSTLLLSMFLISRLSSNVAKGDFGAKEGEELYPKLKSIYALLQSDGILSIELLTVGLMIASWEYCQAKQQDAWMTIGGCARIGNMLGLHLTLREWSNGDQETEMKRIVWWSIVILERIIDFEYEANKLHFATPVPTLNDLLPPVPSGESYPFRVADDLITPEMTDFSDTILFNRNFTRLGALGSTVQMVYLCNLVQQHVQCKTWTSESRRLNAIRLDTALMSFETTLIPGPGDADGRYCGVFGLRVNAAITLNYHELTASDPETVERAKLSLISLSRRIISMTGLVGFGRPLNLDSMSFWPHGACYSAAMIHIRFGKRDKDWEKDLDICKGYLRYFEPRYGLIRGYLRKIEEAEKDLC